MYSTIFRCHVPGRSLGTESLRRNFVMRSYVIEVLIGRNAREMVFWRGVGTPLSRYAGAVPEMMVYLDSPKPAWRAFRASVSVCAKFFPRRYAHIAEALSGRRVHGEANKR